MVNKSGKVYSYGRQQIGEDDIEMVIKVLRSDYLTQGPLVKQFETLLCSKFNASFCSVVSNGTAALHLTGLAAGWSKGDIVITSPVTFVATANSILYSGALPDFCDIDSTTYTIDVNKLEEKIISYIDRGKKIKAVIGVDYAGLPCDWIKLRELADKYNFQLINDNCHAPGASIGNDTGYASKYADMVIMSFHPVKHFTTGEGGAVLTNSSEFDNKIKLLRTHGITKDTNLFENKTEDVCGSWYYEMQQLGFNYRLTDFQCALGISQLNKLDKFISKRRGIADFYIEQFGSDERFIVPEIPANYKHSYHLFPLQIKFEKTAISKNNFFREMAKRNINLQVHYIPVHLQPFYQNNFNFREGDFPVAETFYQNEVSLPVYPSLDKDDLEYIVSQIKELTI